VSVSMIVHNSATRWSYGEPHTSVYCCCSGVSNKAAIRLEFAILTS
jgi:hypothetical protein